MSILTKEGIQKILNDDWLLMDDCEGLENCTVIKELARMALAAMDSEPFAYIIQDKYERERGVEGHLSRSHVSKYVSQEDINEHEITCTPIYRHAQQPTVVGDGRAEFETWMLKRWGRERRDDDFAMGKFIYGEDYADSYTRCVWKAWSASRAAMLAAAPQEVKGE